MSETSSLQREIEELIRPWRNSEKHPGFSYEELIAIALVLHDEPMTRESIMTWIMKTFGYYQEMAAATFWAHFGEYNGNCFSTKPPDDSDEFFDVFNDTFSKFELPVTEITRFCPDDDQNDTYEISTAAARISLERLLAGRTKGKFPFLRLPAELRMTIYELVLGYPRSGLQPVRPSYNRAMYFSVATREFLPTFSSELWESSDLELKVADHESITQILLVNKQIYEEAVSCFYQINTFVFFRITELIHHMTYLAPTRRQHIRHIVLHHSPYDDLKLVMNCFKWLESLSGLRKLDIDIDERLWFSTRKSPRAQQSFTASTIPGFEVLPKLSKTVKIEFAGNCEAISSYWKAEMAKDEQTPEPGTKKRKRTEGERKQPARPAKSRKKQ